MPTTETEDKLAREPLRPYCQVCGWRKGGVDSWDGAACKCGHSEPPMPPISDGRDAGVED